MTIRPDRLPAIAPDGSVNVVVETPRGSHVKFKFLPETGVFGISRPLTLGLHYPFDWGFVPSTRAEDGDPLDALVIHDGTGYPGIVVSCHPIAVLRVRQTESGSTKNNDRVMLIPRAAPRQRSLDDVGALSDQMRTELERFFLMAVAGTGKQLEFQGWEGKKAASDAVKQSAKAFSG